MNSSRKVSALRRLQQRNSWGLMKSLAVSRELRLAATNPSRTISVSCIVAFSTNWLKSATRADSLLPYSPLGGGVLTGKYDVDRGLKELGSRQYLRTGGERQKAMARRFVNEKSVAAAREAGELARALNVSTATLALAWSKQHDFVLRRSSVPPLSNNSRTPSRRGSQTRRRRREESSTTSTRSISIRWADMPDERLRPTELPGPKFPLTAIRSTRFPRHYAPAGVSVQAEIVQVRPSIACMRPSSRWARGLASTSARSPSSEMTSSRSSTASSCPCS